MKFGMFSIGNELGESYDKWLLNLHCDRVILLLFSARPVCPVESLASSPSSSPTTTYVVDVSTARTDLPFLNWPTTLMRMLDINMSPAITAGPNRSGAPVSSA